MTLPTGTVTFLFTDIEGSTKLSQQYQDARCACWRDLDAIHSQLDNATFENVYNTGCNMTEEQAIALAIES